MHGLLRWFRSRLLPAAVTGAGVCLVAAGLLTYGTPASSTPTAGPSASIPSAWPSPTLIPIPTLPSSAGPTASPGPAAAPTRVVVPALQIDLPVVRPPNDPNHFPYCNVAEYLAALSRPGQPGTTYIYAHARVGMFLPILTSPDASMLGMLVMVYTSDDRQYLYEIVRVLRHQTNLDVAYQATNEQLMLQTSEGPRGTIAKTMLVARPLGSSPADHAAANPTPHPLVCG